MIVGLEKTVEQRVPRKNRTDPALVDDDKQVQARLISEATGLSSGSVIGILHDHLCFSKRSARWIPRILSQQAKQFPTDIPGPDAPLQCRSQILSSPVGDRGRGLGLPSRPRVPGGIKAVDGKRRLSSPKSQEGEKCRQNCGANFLRRRWAIAAGLFPTNKQSQRHIKQKN